MLAAMLVFLAPLTHAAPSHRDVSVDVAFDPSKEPGDELWLAYLMARAAYINEHDGAYDWKPGMVIPSYQEELAARTAALTVYRELKEKDSRFDVRYFTELGEVADHSFLGEYVWTYLHHAEWGSPPETLRLVEFMRWRAEHLTQHRVITKGFIRFSAKGKAPAAATERIGTEVPTLLLGRKAVESGNALYAVAAYYDPVIEEFSRIYGGSDTRIYAARNQTQMFIYVALPNEEKKPVEVLDSTWSDAYLMKAYALTELHRPADAQAALQKAIELSPLTAQYISELAFTYQAQGDCERSIATYKQAESVVELGSDDKTKVADLTHALRGQGYCLSELGRFDEAEALYRRCLKLDPSDSKSKSELEYIKRKRAQ
jgi:hypothetical protein